MSVIANTSLGLKSMVSLFRPYVLRAQIRGNLPNALYDLLVDKLGLFDKGEDCEVVGGEHKWYNQDGETSACYYCYVTREGRLWERPNSTSSNLAE